MKQRIAQIALIVKDYDEAVKFITVRRNGAGDRPHSPDLPWQGIWNIVTNDVYLRTATLFCFSPSISFSKC